MDGCVIDYGVTRYGECYLERLNALSCDLGCLATTLLSTIIETIPSVQVSKDRK